MYETENTLIPFNPTSYYTNIGSNLFSDKQKPQPIKNAMRSQSYFLQLRKDKMLIGLWKKAKILSGIIFLVL